MLVHSAVEYIGDVNKIAETIAYSPRLLAIRNMIVSSAMFRRSDFERVGKYDENLTTGYEDWELWIALTKNGGRVLSSPQADFLYRQHGSSRSHLITDGEDRHSKAYIFQKHRDFCWAQ